MLAEQLGLDHYVRNLESLTRPKALTKLTSHATPAQQTEMLLMLRHIGHLLVSPHKAADSARALSDYRSRTNRPSWQEAPWLPMLTADPSEAGRLMHYLLAYAQEITCTRNADPSRFPFHSATFDFFIPGTEQRGPGTMKS